MKSGECARTLLIVFHSMTGGTEQMARAAGTAASAESGVEVRLLRACDTAVADVLQADGYIFATPEMLAAVTGVTKDFFDRTFYGAMDRINGRPYAVMVCAGSDGTNAAGQVARIASGWRLKPVADAIIVCTQAQTPSAILSPKHIPANQLLRCKELGATFAAGLSLGLF